jgi:hypothetical protein
MIIQRFLSFIGNLKLLINDRVCVRCLCGFKLTRMTIIHVEFYCELDIVDRCGMGLSKRQ